MKKKIIITLIISTIVFNAFSQTTKESDILNLSSQIFKWEVENNTTALEKVFHEKFVVIGSDGNVQTKKEYLPKLKSGAFVHDSINVEKNTAIINGNTAIVYGNGMFFVTVSGKKVSLHLSYIEVFTRSTSNSSWQVIAMKANSQ